VAHPNSIVGSIGVFAGKFSLNKLYDKIGMNLAKIYRGENAGIFSESQKFTPEQRTII
ncbi:MAG: signal peptide peptidase SppA, partial [Calditrichae bacterium]|nr:signal peptide peptidase SppA [Calditrichia bacterium]